MYGTATNDIPTAPRGQDRGHTAHEWPARRNPSSFELRDARAKAGWTP
jgi:hypothetical protein